jgi:amino acid adenylation domain-containing protein
MMSSSRTRLRQPINSSNGSAIACAGLSALAEDKRAQPGDDLLRHLPTDRESNAAPTRLAVATHRISSTPMDRLFHVSASLGTDCDVFFMSAFATLLARLAGQEVVRLRNILGDPNILTFRFDPEVSFRSLLAAILSQSHSPDQPCAVEYAFGFEEFSGVDFPRDVLRLSVQVLASHGQAEFQIRLISSTGLWDRPILHLWLRYFDRLLAAVAGSPDVPWKTLPLLDPNEAQEFYLAFNRTAEHYPDSTCVHELVTRQAERTPDAIAVVSESRSLTYRQLHARSNAIAHRLQALGAGPDRPVAISLERTAQLPVALLGILKSGSCYVPLDQQDSPERLASILEECRPAALILDHSFPPLRGTDAIPLIYPDDIPDPSPVDVFTVSGVTPEHQAYIIYTSGTTGKPKGVTIRHRALANLLNSVMRAPGFTPADRMLAVSPISFDIATMDMFLPLVAGGILVVADRFVGADPSRLAALLVKFDVTVLQATPATWRLLASSDWKGKRDLKMISGGEALPRDLANRLLSHGGELWNCYGPTETTIYSGVIQIQSEPGLVPIGPPIANTMFYVLDDAGRLLPPGVPGELYIGGTGVSSGYVDPSQDLRHSFSPDPYAQVLGARMFKSGDLVRLINGNEFEFFGRRDHQVKLRGYRIELGEIESALRTFPNIENAVATLRENEPGEPYLIAYFTATNKQLDLRQVRDHLSRLLPAYMVPTRYMLMDAMPLTPSGKIDRKVLLASASSGLSAYLQPEGVRPRTALEGKLLTIFRDVLNTAEFGVTDSFFEYGGYSLLTVKLFDRINRALKLSLPISLLFDAPTVRALAEIIDLARPLPLIVPIRPRGGAAPLFVIHSYLLYGVLPYIVEPDRPVYGVRELMDVSQSQTIEERATIYVKEILKVYPDGRLLLAGWCAAGSLTVEIARQLGERNHQVGLVALLDAERPGYRPLLRGNRTARLLARVTFHVRRLRGGSIRQKVEYVRSALRHSWESVLESLFMHHRPLLMGLQRVLGFSLPDAVFNNTWSRVAALQNYAPTRYPGRVILFRAMDVPQLPGSDETLGWKEIVDDGIEVVFVPGDHESMFHKPNVDSFSRRFCQALRLAEYELPADGFDRAMKGR